MSGGIQSDSSLDFAAFLTAADNVQLYDRACTLLVSTKNGVAIDLSALRIKFATKGSAEMTPNTATIRIYNMADDTIAQIKKEFTNVLLQAGYASNFGVIFKGNIKQALVGRESATDTYLDLVCGDGDKAFNFSIVNTTLAAGSQTSDHVNAAVNAMVSNGVTGGLLKVQNTKKLPRGKVLYDSAKNILRKAAQSANSTWSIQDEQVQFLSETTYLGNEVVVLNSSTGMIGTPTQTVQGVNARCLLNPRLKANNRIQINEKEIEKYKIDYGVPGTINNTPVNLTADGVYFLYGLEHTGDTRGGEWYSNLTCITISVSSNPLNSVGNGS